LANPKTTKCESGDAVLTARRGHDNCKAVLREVANRQVNLWNGG